MNQTSLKIRKSKLLNELKKITKAVGPISKWNRYTAIELTITDGLSTLLIPGIRLELPCETSSTAEATLGLFYFRDIIKNWAVLHLECFIQDEVFNGKRLYFKKLDIVNWITLTKVKTKQEVNQLADKYIFKYPLYLITSKRKFYSF